MVVSAALVLSGAGAAGASASAAVSVRRGVSIRAAASRRAESASDSSGQLSRPDSESAQVTARATGKRVEDLSQEGETTRVYANPDGSWTSETSDSPARVQDSNGDWHDVDTTLVVRDGRVVPKWAPSDLSFSNGGDKELVDLTQDGKDLGLKWTSDLPTPALSGDTATYADVEPDTDLVVRALSTGFEDSLVLKSQPDGQVAFTTPVASDGANVTATSDGAVVIGPAKDPIVTATPPVVYDSSDQSPGVSVSSPATSTASATVGKTASGTPEVTIKPDQAFLEDPSTVYPVTIDPAYSIHPYGDTWLDNASNQTSQGTSSELDVGTYDGGTHKARTFFQFTQGDSTWDGTDVLSANLVLRDWNSQTCTAAPIRAAQITSSWTFGGISWSNQPTVSSAHYGEYSPAHGHSSACPVDDATFDVTSIVKAWATGSPNYGIRLKADDETNSNTWRQYRSTNYMYTSTRPLLTTTYNRYPNVPPTPQVKPVSAYAPYGGLSSLYTSDTTPAVSATVKDPDGGTVRLHAEAYTSTTATTSVSACNGPYVASGGVSSCSLGTALPDGTYYVRAKAYDGTDYSNGGSNAGWSGWTTVVVATATPAAPSISCSNVNGSWAASAPSSNPSCTISTTGSGSSAPATVTYSVDGAAPKTVTITQPLFGSPSPVTVSVSKAEGGHTITATSSSPSGIHSNEADYGFGYGQLGLTKPFASPLAMTTDTVTIDATGPPAASGVSPTVSMKWRAAGSGLDDATGWTTDDDPGLNVTSDSSGVHVGGEWDTNHVFGSGSSLNSRIPVLLDVQVCITYGSSGTQCSWATTHRQVEHIPHAFGNGYPTVDVPDGQAALWTGEFATDKTDADLSAGSNDLSISRSASTYAGPAADPAAGVFGPGWIASLSGPDAGDADLQVIDSTRIDGTIDTMDGDGNAMVFAPASGIGQRTGADLTTGDWVPVDDATQESGVTASVSGSGSSTVFKLIEPDGTVTTFGVNAAPTSSTDAVFTPASVDEPGEASNTTYSYDSANRVTRILAPSPAGVTCPATGALPTGCRALTIAYASSTTATAGSPGDYAGQVSAISTLVGDGTSGGKTTVVAVYRYDQNGRLVSVTDPRDSLTTAYTYDGSSNRLASITDAGLKTISYNYSGSANKLSTVTRDRPAGDPTGGTATLDTIVYDVATHGTGLPDLSAGSIAAWNQTDVPTYAAAVFGPDHPVDPSSVSSSDWPYAEVYYTDSKGYQTNTAEYGAGRWLYTDTEYDDLGSPVRELDEADIANIQNGDTSPSDAGTLTTYNAEKDDVSGNVSLAADSVTTDIYAPARYAILADGSTAWVRQHSHTDYDQGAPNSDVNPATSQQYALPTTVTVSASDPSSQSDLQTLNQTKTGYDNAVPGGDADAGWSLGLASSTTTVMGSGASDIVSKTSYDAQGRVASTSQPKSNGSDAGTRDTVYYTAGTNSQVAACGNKPEWADLLCQTNFAAAPSAGPDLITSRVTGYNDLQEATEVTETSGSTTRTTTKTYRSDGSQTGNSVAVTGLSGSAPVPSVTYGYDPNTGLQTSINPSSGSTITTGYDSWGRQTSYSPATGESTTTAYNSADEVGTVTDAQGSTSYTYDGTDSAGGTERRGLVTKLDVSNAAGTTPVEFTGSYDAAGDLIQETMPGRITLNQAFDTVGDLTDMVYAGDVTTTDDSGTSTTSHDQPWIAWSQTHDAMGRIIDQWTPAGATLTGDTSGATATGYSRHYAYDRADRLTEVVDQEATGTGTIADPGDTSSGGSDNLATTSCAIRDYSFDANGNRTALKTTPAASDGSCQTGSSPTGVTTKSWSYDSADRLTGGYTYDNLGRQTTIPQVDSPAARVGGNPGDLTLGYYDTDAAHTITQNGSTTTYGLDAAGRRLTATAGPTGGTGTSTITNHYDDSTDNPAWASTATSSGTAVERYTSGLGDGLTAMVDGGGVVHDVVNDPDGNTVSTIVLSGISNASGLDEWDSYDEYGNLDNGGTAGVTPTSSGGGSAAGNGYGWHGQAQRATSGAGLVLMGSRLYNPTVGAFSSPDSVFHGNTTSYAYPQDPINQADIDGRWWKWIKKLAHAVGKVMHSSLGTALGYAASWLGGGACRADIACGFIVGFVVSFGTYAVTHKGRFNLDQALLEGTIGAVEGELGAHGELAKLRHEFKHVRRTYIHYMSRK